MGDCLEICHHERGIGHGLAEEGPGLVVHCGAEGLGVMNVYELHGDAEARQNVVEHREGAAV